ncbi:hypothetical protein [Bdellovibrio sp. BCCA]|uniref:hypothetical protein n=1 Tax=Bdellovibrio sp. BCCA TaxID=3136281 RepID=UPI0030EFF3A3
MKKQQFEEMIEKRRKRKEAIKAFFFFPKTLAARYRFLIKGFSEIENRWDDTKEKMNAYKSSYKKLVEFMVMIPLYFGLLFGAVSVVQVGYAATQISWKNYYKKDVKKKVIRVGKTKVPFLNVERAATRLYERVEKKGGKPWLLFGIPVFFVLSFGGAFILSSNPIFSQSEKIKKALKDFKFTDAEGEPWEFVYTPDLIMFRSYGIVADEFVRKKNFWTTINFSPQPARVSSDDQNVFLIRRKTQMPTAVIYGNFSTLPSIDELLEMSDEDDHSSPNIMKVDPENKKVTQKATETEVDSQDLPPENEEIVTEKT